MDDRMKGIGPEEAHLDGDALCEYAEGLADAAARAAAEAHLRKCAACSRELEAMRSYFQDMAGLEPVKAPPGFLAGVHARLPRPSPWKKAWMGLWSPRGVPFQIAFLTLLGITAITAYLHQRGGVISEAPTILSLPEAAPRAPAAPSVSEDKDEASPAKKAAEAPIAKSKSSLADRKERDRPAASLGAISELANERPDADAEPAAPRMERSAEKFAAQKSESEPASMAPPSAESPGEAEALSKPAPAGRGNQAARGTDSPRETHTGFTIRMKTIADTSAMLAGLRNMGAAIEPGHVTGELRYSLRLPSSMLPDMLAYLGRYGEARYEDEPVPAVRDGNVSVFLRILPN